MKLHKGKGGDYMTKKEAFLVALMENPTISKAIEQAGISKSTGYKYLGDDDFQKELLKRKSEAMSEAVTYLQGKLSRCGEVLMDIVEDTEISPQVRINAINSVFSNTKLMTESVDILLRIAELEEKTKSNKTGGDV
jgi:ACT domain-containing protein